MAVPGARIPDERCTVTAAWSAVPGRYPRNACRKKLAERDPSDDDDGHRSGCSCACVE